MKRQPGNQTGLANFALGPVIHSVGSSKTFNFITLRQKGTPGSSVSIQVYRPGAAGRKGKGAGSKGFLSGGGGNALSSMGGEPPLYVIESRFSAGNGLAEISRWIVPQPIVDLIFHCSTLPGIGKGLSTGGLSTGGL